MPSQQLEANAFVTDHYGSMKPQAVQEQNRVHNAREHEKVENHSLASMSTTKIIMIFKNKNVSKVLGRKGPLLGMYFLETVSCPLEAPLPHPPKKNYMVASESPSPKSSDPLSNTNAEESVS